MSKRNLIPIFQAAEETGMPVVVIERLCDRGQVRSQRLSGRLCVDRKSLEKFTARNRRGKNPAHFRAVSDGSTPSFQPFSIEAKSGDFASEDFMQERES